MELAMSLENLLLPNCGGLDKKFILQGLGDSRRDEWPIDIFREWIWPISSS